MDIFEMLRDALGCMYISDIKLEMYKARAIELLKRTHVDGSQKADICNYLGIGVI